MLVEIRVLGPLEVVDEHGPVPLGGPTRRALLGLLALRAGRVVSQEALVDGLWDEQPPPSALRTLHAHVAHLRRVLAENGLGAPIDTRAPGYLLTAVPGLVDVDRFSELVRGRRSEPAERTAERLRAALGLWRGEVLADCMVRGDWARAEATRLQESRLSATEQLYAAELATGRYQSAVTDLESLVARHPLRERLWELLMLALHRDRRPAQALHVYRRAYAALQAELGVAPGPALRRLEAAIRAGAEPATAATARITVPVPVTSLVGRDRDLAELGGLLRRRRLVTLTGVGGSGKTRLAIAAAAATPGAVGFVDLTAITEAAAVTAVVCDVLGLRDDPTPAALVRRLRERELLLVLDNCEHLLLPCADLVQTLLRSCPGLRVLTTSSRTLGVPGETEWPVQPLPVPDRPAATLAELQRFDAVRLFLDRCALPAVHGLRDADAPAVAAICTGLDGLPLALELAAARTAVLTVAEIAARLRDPATLGGSRSAGRPHHRALDATMAWSYDALEPAARDRFRRLAVFAGGFTLDAAAAVWNELDGRTVDALAELAARSLIMVDRRDGYTRYRLLETIRHFVAARLTADPAQDAAARQRHAGHYLALAQDADRRLRGPDSAHWLDRLGADHENLRAALHWYAGRGGPDELRLAVALARYCRLRGRYGEGRRWLLDALDRGAALPVADRAPALLSAAFLAYFQGSYAEATRHARAALAGHREFGDWSAAARCLRLLGSITCERGEYQRSAAWYAHALAAYQHAEDDPGRADILQMTGFVSWLAGDLDAASPTLDDALRCYGALDDAENVASTRVHLAAVALYRGEIGQARWFAEEALAQFTKLDFKEGIGWATNILGLVALADGAIGLALATLGTSLGVHWHIGDRWRQASLLDALAAAWVAAGDPVRATELTGLATALRDELGVPVPAVERPAADRTRAESTRLLGQQEWHAAFARGKAMAVIDVLPRG